MTRGPYTYGIACDDDLGGYAVYCTDFVDAWVEKLWGEDLKARAMAQGFDLVAEATVRALLEELQAVTLRIENGPVVESTGDTNWQFVLTKCTPHDTVKVVHHILRHLLQAHNYLVGKTKQLEQSLRKKDDYITFLEENFKALHGDELLTKYAKMHANEEAKVHNSYREAAAFEDDSWDKCRTPDKVKLEPKSEPESLSPVKSTVRVKLESPALDLDPDTSPRKRARVKLPRRRPAR